MLNYKWSRHIIPFAFAGLGLMAMATFMDEYLYTQILMWLGIYLFAWEYRFFDETVKKTITIANQENMAYVVKPIETVHTPQRIEEIQQQEVRSFMHLNPVVSYPQKKLVFYQCALHKKSKAGSSERVIADFFETLQFINLNLQNYRDVRFIVDLSREVLSDETYRDVLITHVERGDYPKEALLFNITYDVLSQFDETLTLLGELGMRFSLESIETEMIDRLLSFKLHKHIYCYKIKQTALLHLIRDTFFNEKIHELGDNNTRIMVTDLDDETQIEDLPTIVDYAVGRALGGGLKVPVV